MIGKTISHYKILDKLGAGGMGIVYKAEDTKLKRPVALKFLPPDLIRDEEAKKRFVHEAQAASALEHPNICNIHEINETEDGQTYIVMACYEGQSLKDKIAGARRDVPMGIDEIIKITKQVARGMQKAHEKGITHRDLKPANVMIDEDGTVKILDFGLAKLSGQTMLTKTGSTMGTISYMSPEQARGTEVDQRSDIWSAGVMLYEMLTGELPFKGDYDQAVVYSIINENPTSPSTVNTEIPAALEAIIFKALGKETPARYQSMDELIADLQNYEQGLEIALPRVKKSKKQYLWAAILSLIVILAVAYQFIYKPLAETESGPVPIVVISFENLTGDESYDYLRRAIPNLLITSLEQQRFFRVITWERLLDLLRQAGKENVENIDRETGFELCRMEGVQSIVLGSFVKAGNTFSTDIKVLDVKSKKLLISAKSSGVGIGSILQRQIDELSRGISLGVDRPEHKIQPTQFSISQITNSMEAYNYYVRGKDYNDKFYSTDAIRLLERAIDLDSTFSMAYLEIAGAYGNKGFGTKYLRAMEKARKFSEKAPEKERLTIEAEYIRRIDKDYRQAILIYESLIEKYPLDKEAHMSLGRLYRDTGQRDRAIEEFNYVIRLDPQHADAHNTIGYVYAYLSDFEKAKFHIHKAVMLQPGEANALDSMADIYFMKGEIDSAIIFFKEADIVKPNFNAHWRVAYCYALSQNYAEALKWNEQWLSVQSSYAPSDYYFIKGLYQHFQGRSGDALENYGNAQRNIYIIENQKNKKVTFDKDPTRISRIKWSISKLAAWIYYDLGKFHEGERILEGYTRPLLKADPEFTAWCQLYLAFYRGLVHLKEGKIDSARHYYSEARRYYSEIPADTWYIPWEDNPIGKAGYLCDFLAAEIAFAGDSLNKAIEFKKKAQTYFYPRMAIFQAFTYNLPFKDDLLPRIYLAKGDTNQAVAEYERITRINPEDRDRRFIPNMFNYRLARLYESQGKKDKAIQRYQHFLNVWKDADANLPELIDAQRRLEALENPKSKI